MISINNKLRSTTYYGYELETEWVRRGSRTPQYLVKVTLSTAYLTVLEPQHRDGGYLGAPVPIEEFQKNFIQFYRE